MSKKRIVKFMIDDEVTFKNEFEMQMFGFFFINDIIYHNGTIKYQLYRYDLNNNKELVAGYYTDNDLSYVPVTNEVQKHKKDKHIKTKKHKAKKQSYDSLPYIDLIIGYIIDNQFILERTKLYKTVKQAWKAIKKQFPNAIFKCSQMIDFVNYNIDNDEYFYS